MDLSDRILNRFPTGFRSRFIVLEQYRDCLRASHLGVFESRRINHGRKGWKPGGAEDWHPVALITSRQSGVLMISFYHDGVNHSFQAKKLIYSAFVAPVGLGYHIENDDHDESNIGLCNLSLVSGRFQRRTNLYRDRKT